MWTHSGALQHLSKNGQCFSSNSDLASNFFTIPVFSVHTNCKTEQCNYFWGLGQYLSLDQYN